MNGNMMWFGMLVICASAIIAGIVCQRFAILPVKLSLGLMALGVVVAALVALVALGVWIMALAGILSDSNTPLGIVVAGGLAPLALIILLVGPSGLKAPPIHNISTSPDEPFEFIHAQTLRQQEHNSLVPPSPKVVLLQKQHYPELSPLIVNLGGGLTESELLAAIKDVVNELGWELTYVQANPIHIEAVEKTPLMGFADDIAVRVTVNDGGAAEVNVRSVSRVGVSDLGANAARIQHFLLNLEKRIK